MVIIHTQFGLSSFELIQVCTLGQLDILSFLCSFDSERRQSQDLWKEKQRSLGDCDSDDDENDG